MIYKRDKYDELPDAFQVRSLLKKIQDITPVKHLMPTERVVDGEDKYLLTHLANGRFDEKQKQVVKENFHAWADTVMQGFKKRLRESGRLI